MALPDQPLGAAPPDVLRFGCPACRGELSIPFALAGAAGPCPLCGEQIVAPVPERDQAATREATLADAFHHLEDSLETEAPLPAVEASPADLPEMRYLYCEACGCELEIDPDLAHLQGGPCPKCQTWIDLQGRPSGMAVPEEKVSASPASRSPKQRAVTGDLSLGEISRPTELNQKTAESPSDFNFRCLEPSPEPESGREENEEENEFSQEGRRVKKRVRRRQLPSEFYVGHVASELDRRGRESTDRKRKNRFSEAGSSGRQRRGDEVHLREGRPIGWLPVFTGILISVVGVLVAALYFDFVNPADLRFWEATSPVETPYAIDPLAESIERTEEAMNGKAKESYQAVETAIDLFVGAGTWEEAKEYLSLVHMPANSEALAFLKMFPREVYRGATVKVIDYARIPQTERFVFTTHVSKGIDERGDEILIFMVVEPTEAGTARVHALQLYQSWKRTLTEYLETSGAPGGRFYAAVRRAPSEPALTFPNDGPYIKLEIQDLLVEQPWVKEVYVREESWAGTRLLTTLTDHWSKAVLDLEWLQGPSGDVFVHVAGLQSSNWGSFP